MEGSKTHTIELTLEQKKLFDKWLYDTEKDLEARLEDIKSLRSQTSNNKKDEPKTAIIHESFKMTAEMQPRSQSWTSKTIQALSQMGGAQTSTQVISWLMAHDKDLHGKDKRYITKNVTSKLAILVDNGRVEKKVIAGKNFYALKEPSL